MYTTLTPHQVLRSSQCTLDVKLSSTLLKRARIVSLWLLTFVMLGAPICVHAAPTLSVQVIEAYKKPKSSKLQVAASLKPMQQYFKKNFPAYRKFKKLKASKLKVNRNKAQLALTPQLKAQFKLDLKSKSVVLTTKIKGKKPGKTKSSYGQRFFQAFKWRKRTFILALKVTK